MKVEFILNGAKKVAEAEAAQSLLDLLRSLGLASVRAGCDTGNCGLCTVWVNGAPTLACAYPALRAGGQSVTTVEGVKKEADELAAYMAREGADQCGYCSPGFIMAALALKKAGIAADETAIRHYMAGNLCRCTGYASQSRILQSYLLGVQTP